MFRSGPQRWSVFGSIITPWQRKTGLFFLDWTQLMGMTENGVDCIGKTNKYKGELFLPWKSTLTSERSLRWFTHFLMLWSSKKNLEGSHILADEGGFKKKMLSDLVVRLEDGEQLFKMTTDREDFNHLTCNSYPQISRLRLKQSWH